MPSLLDPPTRSELVAESVNEILVLDGAPAVTMRALATRTGISASSLLHHLDSREHIIRVSARLTAQAALRDIERRRLRDDLGERLDAHLPAEESALRAVSVWAAWAEFARHAAFLQPVVGKWHLEERALLRDVVVDPEVARSATTESATDSVFAHLCGLRMAMCRPIQPLGLSAARQSLREVCALNRCRRSVA